MDTRPQQHEFAIACDQEIADRIVTVTGGNALADETPQILGELGIGSIDRLVLANEAAQFLGDLPGTRFKRRVGKPLGGIDCESRTGKGQKQDKGGEKTHRVPSVTRRQRPAPPGEPVSALRRAGGDR